MAFVKCSNFDPEKVEFGAAKSTKFGTFISLSYDGSPFYMQTPEMYMPFDSNYFPDKDKNTGKWTVRSSLKGSGDVEVFQDKLSTLDDIVMNKVMDNSLEWMKKKNLSKETVAELYNPTIKLSKDPDTGEPDGKYPASYQFKVEHKDNAMKCKVYNKDKVEYDINLNSENPLSDVLVKGSNIKALVKCNCLWIINGKMGLSWMAEQLRVDVGSSRKIIGYALSDDEDEPSKNNYIESEEEEEEEVEKEPEKQVKKRVVKRR